MIKWLREGDRNTKYFHVATAERRKRNKLEMLKTENRGECREELEIAKEIASYFKSLFTSANTPDCDEIIE